MTATVISEAKKRMSIYLTPSLKEDLEKLAASKSRTISNMVEVLVRDAVEKAKKQGEIE
jgi:predicted DNA-binding protein